MVHRRSTANHADECRANGVSPPCLPCDFQRQWRLYRSRTPVYLGRVSCDSLLKYHVPRHRPERIDNDSTQCWSHLVCTIGMLWIVLKKSYEYLHQAWIGKTSILTLPKLCNILMWNDNNIFWVARPRGMLWHIRLVLIGLDFSSAQPLHSLQSLSDGTVI